MEEWPPEASHHSAECRAFALIEYFVPADRPRDLVREPELLGRKYLASPFGELSKPCTADAVREPDPNLSPAVTTLDFLPTIFLVSELVSVGPGIGARCCGVAHDGYDRPQNQAILAVLRSGKPGSILVLCPTNKWH